MRGPDLDHRGPRTWTTGARTPTRHPRPGAARPFPSGDTCTYESGSHTHSSASGGPGPRPEMPLSRLSSLSIKPLLFFFLTVGVQPGVSEVLKGTLLSPHRRDPRGCSGSSGTRFPQRGNSPPALDRQHHAARSRGAGHARGCPAPACADPTTPRRPLCGRSRHPSRGVTGKPL